jgi:prepilin-type processing-associated H-X9-DG protein
MTSNANDAPLARQLGLLGAELPTDAIEGGSSAGSGQFPYQVSLRTASGATAAGDITRESASASADASAQHSRVTSLTVNFDAAGTAHGSGGGAGKVSWSGFGPMSESMPDGPGDLEGAQAAETQAIGGNNLRQLGLAVHNNADTSAAHPGGAQFAFGDGSVRGGTPAEPGQFPWQLSRWSDPSQTAQGEELSIISGSSGGDGGGAGKVSYQDMHFGAAAASGGDLALITDFLTTQEALGDGSVSFLRDSIDLTVTPSEAAGPVLYVGLHYAVF